MPRGEALHEQAQRCGIAHTLGHLEGSGGSDEGAIGVPARARCGEAAQPPAVSGAPDDLGTRDEGELLRREIGVLDRVGVGVVDAGRIDLEHLEPGDRIGVREFDEFEDFGAAEAGDLDGAHRLRLGGATQTAHSPPSQQGWM